MENNYLVSSLIPFIEDDEIAYYSQLEDEKITLLISLAPFSETPQQLKMLSKLDSKALADASEILPVSDSAEIKTFFSKLS